MTTNEHKQSPKHNEVVRAAVIDFECAYNREEFDDEADRERHWRSVCEIGWQVVEIGPGANVRLLDETGGMKLRPPDNHYEGWDAHGIKPADTEHQPTFLEFWVDDLRHRFDALGVCDLMPFARSFDRNVFLTAIRYTDGLAERLGGDDQQVAQLAASAALDANGEPWRWRSASGAARLIWKKRGKRGLEKLAAWKGITYEAHRAQADAVTTAKLLALMADEPDVTFEMLTPDMPPRKPPPSATN